MNELERQLRAALHHATEPAPPGLLAAVMRRHRRHRKRIGAGMLAVAALVAAAVPPATHALVAPTQRRPTTTVGSASPSPIQVRPEPGTVLSGCGMANLGLIGQNWRRTWRNGLSTHAGPLWFLDGGHSSPAKNGLSLYVAIVVLDGSLKPGSLVVVKVTPAGRPSLRFLYGPADTMNAGTRYTKRSGESGVTFESCTPVEGITNYYGGFLVRGSRCVPVHVWVPGRVRPMLIHLGACAGA